MTPDAECADDCDGCGAGTEAGGGGGRGDAEGAPPALLSEGANEGFGGTGGDGTDEALEITRSEDVDGDHLYSVTFPVPVANVLGTEVGCVELGEVVAIGVGITVIVLNSVINAVVVTIGIPDGPYCQPIQSGREPLG